jgi:hypothetical protein
MKKKFMFCRSGKIRKNQGLAVFKNETKIFDLADVIFYVIFFKE